MILSTHWTARLCNMGYAGTEGTLDCNLLGFPKFYIHIIIFIGLDEYNKVLICLSICISIYLSYINLQIHLSLYTNIANITVSTNMIDFTIYLSVCLYIYIQYNNNDYKYKYVYLYIMLVYTMRSRKCC